MPTPLLCELHAHTTFSDGTLTPAELVDLYGAAGFDVLAITDHVCRAEVTLRGGARSVCAANHRRYLTLLEAEAERARRVYDLLVVPGLELTHEDVDPTRSAHALAIGLRSWAGVDDGLDAALEAARGRGAALIAAHPYTLEATVNAPRTTARFAEEREWAREAVDRFELCNRHDFFPWVAHERLAVVATGDFHRADHLPGDVEDPAAMRERGRGSGGLPALGTRGVARAGRPADDRRERARTGSLNQR